jgi:hypothetical protein
MPFLILGRTGIRLALHSKMQLAATLQRNSQGPQNDRFLGYPRCVGGGARDRMARLNLVKLDAHPMR